MLRLENLKKSYLDGEGNPIPVVDVSEFFLDHGSIVALYGDSGSGKTTFLNLIAGILAPDHGTLKFAGSYLHELDENQRDQLRAKSIGYIFQSFHLLQACTALENLLVAMSFAGKVDSSRAKELLKIVGLAERMNHKPNELSIGQQQRVALARAVVNQPSLVLADEPTGNLDERNTQVSLDILKELCEVNEASMIIVSHDSKVISSFETKMNWSDLNRVQENPVSKND